MADDTKISLEVVVDGNAEVQLKKIGDAAASLEVRGTKSIFSFSRAMEVASGVIAGSAILETFKAISNAATGLAKVFISDSVRAAEEAQVAQNKLNQSLALAGEYSKEASDKFSKFASEIQRTTTVEDDAVRSAAALLQSMAQLSEQGLEDATKAAIDMSAALGIDLDTAVRMVGKAANGEVGSFKKLGISIEEGDTKAETLSNTLEVLNDKFGGSAAAQVNTFAGSTAQLKNNFGDLQEEIGNSVVENNALVDAFKEASKIVGELGAGLSENKQSLKLFVAEGFILAIEAAQVFTIALDTLGRVGSAAVQILITPVKALATGIVAAQQAIDGQFSAAIETLRSGAVAAGEDIGKALTEDTKLGEVAVLLERVKTAAVGGTEAIRAGAEATVAPLNSAKVAVDELTEAQIALGLEGQKVAERLAGEDPKLKYERDLEALIEANDQKLELALGYEAALAQLELDRDTKILEKHAKEIADLNAKNDALKALDADLFATQIAANEAKIKTITDSEGKFSKSSLQQKKKESEEETKIRLATAASVAGILGNMTTVAKAFGKEGFEAAKRLAQAQAIVNTYSSAVGAYNSAVAIPVVGAFLAPVAAAAAIAAGLANVAQIESTHLAGGIDSVPAGFERDNFPAMLQTGERVVPRESNKDLTTFLAGGGETNQLLGAILSRLNQLQPQVAVTLDGREIFNSMRSQLNSGRSFA